MYQLKFGLVVLICSLLTVYSILPDEIVVPRVEFSPQTTLITSENIDDLNQIAEVEIGQGRIRFSPDGRYIIVVHDLKVRVIDSVSGREIANYHHANCRFREVCWDELRDVAVSNNNQWLITASSSWANSYYGSIKLWKIGEKNVTASLVRDIGIYAIDLSYDDTLLAYQINDRNRELRLMNMDSRQPISTFQLQNVGGFAFSPTEPILAYSRHGLQLWNYQTNQLTRVVHKYVYAFVQYSPNGDWIAAWNDESNFVLNNISLINAHTGNHRKLAVQTYGHISDVVFSPDSGLIAVSHSGSSNVVLPNAVQLWDVETGDVRLTFQGHEMGMGALSFSADGGLLAARGFDSSVHIWDVDDGSKLRTIPIDRQLIDARFSPSGRLLVVKTILDIQVWGISNSGD